MQPIQLFELASRQAHWLSVRQSVVAGNIANANTPGYVAKDVEPFQAVLEAVSSQPSSGAMNVASFGDAAQGVAEDPQSVTQISTGRAVSLESELLKAGEVRRDYQLNTGVVKAFHRMMLMTVRT